MCKPSDKRYVLDRFEEGVAVLIGDDGETITVGGLGGREGDVFLLLDGEDGGWKLLAEERSEREARIRAKRDRLFGKREDA